MCACVVCVNFVSLRADVAVLWCPHTEEVRNDGRSFGCKWCMTRCANVGGGGG